MTSQVFSATLVRQSRTALEEGTAARAAPLLGEALGLWRGDPLSDLPAHLVRGVVAALDEQRLDALELRIDADLALGRAADVLPELRGLIAGYPLREHFRAQRMPALFHCGRQGEALESHRQVTALLADELGVAPGAGLRQVHQRLLAAAPDLIEVRAARMVPPSRGGDLPVEMTTFVGRETQMAEVRRLLGSARLVTLTRVGGVGRTRLALRAAAEAAPSFADGVRLADLAPLSDADLLDRVVSEALGLRDQSARPAADGVADHLRDRRLLLVLDNCEHLVEHVAGLVLRPARAAPGLRVLATSRQRPGTPGEHVLTVPSLTLPAVEGTTGGATARRNPAVEASDDVAATTGVSAASDADDPLLCSEAVRLLLDRAAASAPRLPAHRPQPPGGGPTVRAAGRHPPRHRTRRGTPERDDGRGDPRAPRRPVPPAVRAAAAHVRPRSPHPSGHRRLELRPVHRRRTAALEPAVRDLGRLRPSSGGSGLRGRGRAPGGRARPAGGAGRQVDRGGQQFP
ncbi:AfsR/SARP family transcriptional regulator [Streptomyces luteogriseus]|uniref:AfsR/SARP family transcriptional regulator n=1 Tax=Streptomyces luteogriseus TaxID=68233 RepID=UPI0036993DF0